MLSVFPQEAAAEAMATQAVLGTKIDFLPVRKHELREARLLALTGMVNECADERVKKIAMAWMETRERYL